MTEYSLISHFALTISPSNRTIHEGFILIVCHARLHATKTGTGHGKAAAAISCLGGSSSSHPHIPALRPSQRELIAIEAAIMSATASLYRRKQEAHFV
jgi:hypothetical protein